MTCILKLAPNAFSVAHTQELAIEQSIVQELEASLLPKAAELQVQQQLSQAIEEEPHQQVQHDEDSEYLIDDDDTMLPDEKSAFQELQYNSLVESFEQPLPPQPEQPSIPLRDKLLIASCLLAIVFSICLITIDAKYYQIFGNM
ncbi:hypothetical protein KR044_001323 [Drosophila immigrans]|nr:hypothetical protein KR044_001323 [Drosophila immigrans]